MWRQGPGLVKIHTGAPRSAMQRSIKIEHRRCNNSEAYFIAGRGSATDSATSAVRHKMATTVEARIISDVVKSLRYEQESCLERNDDGAVTSTY